MRTLIIVKAGETPITNRDVTGMEALEVQAVVNELKAANPGPELQWFKHTCGETGCSEKEFTPKVTAVPAPEPAPAPIEPVAIEKKPKPKKNQPQAVKRGGGSNNSR